MYRIYRRYIPHGCPRNRITRRDNISRVKSPRVQPERVRIDVGTYTWAAFPSRGRTRSRFIVVYVAEPARINAASLSFQPPYESFAAGPRCFILRARSSAAFFPVRHACVRSPRNDLASLRKRFCDNGRRARVIPAADCSATGNAVATNVGY